MGKVTIDVDFEWESEQEYYILMDEGFVNGRDSGFPSEGINDPSRITFKTRHSPILTDYSNIIQHNLDFLFQVEMDISIDYKQPIEINSGNVYIRNYNTDQIIDTVDVTTGVASGNFLKISSNGSMDRHQDYYITTDNGIVKTDDGFLSDAITDKNDPNVDISYETEPTQPVSVITLVYPTPISKNLGNIYLYKSSDDTLVESFEVNDSTVELAYDTLTIAPTDQLFDNTIEYYVLCDAGIVKDSNGFASVPIDIKDDYGTVIYNVTYSIITGIIQLVFDRAIVFNLGNITIKQLSNDAVIQDFDVSELTIDFNVINIDIGLVFGRDYYITINSNAIRDTDGLNYPGIDDNSVSWTVGGAPKLDEFDPALSEDFRNLLVTAKFNQLVNLATGTIQLYKTTNDALIKTYDVSTDVVFDGADTITFNLPPNLEGQSHYYFLTDTGIFLSQYDGSESIPITSKEDWWFNYSADVVYSVKADTIIVDEVGGVGGFEHYDTDLIEWVVYDTFPQTLTGSQTDEQYFRSLISEPAARIEFNSSTNLTYFKVYGYGEVTDFNYYFNGNTTLKTIEGVPGNSKIYQNISMCQDCTALEMVNGLDFSSLVISNSAFKGCSSLVIFNVTNTNKLEQILATWQDCSGFSSFPLIDTSSVTNFNNAWSGCSGLTSFPAIDTSSADGLAESWEGCSSLTSFPYIDTSTSTGFYRTWADCTSLECLSAVNTLNYQGGSTLDMFANTPNLVRPDRFVEQPAIEAGDNWVNDEECPLSPPLFTGSIEDMDLYNNITMTQVDVSGNFTAGGDVTSYTLGNSPPAWMNIDDLGVITGTPNSISNSDVGVQGINDAGTAFSNLFNVNVREPTAAFLAVITRDDTETLINIELTGTAKIDGTTYTTGTHAITLSATPTEIRNDGDLGGDLTEIKFLDDVLSAIDIQDAGQLTSCYEMCFNLSKLVSFNMINSFQVTIMYSAWWGCSGLTSFPIITTTAVTNFGQTWEGCTGLTSFPNLDTSVCTGFNEMFSGCSNLICITNIDTLAATPGPNTESIFRFCTALTAPDATEQTAIENGADWTNPGSCP